MKIQIENNRGVKITIESPNDNYLDNVGEISKKMRDVMIHLTTEDNKCEPQVQLTSTVATPIQERDRNLVRQRIPNNVVDVKDLSIEKAVTENALVRCPKCGQAHCLAVPSNGRIYMMRRNYLKNEFGIIADFSSIDSLELINACCKENTDRQAYFNDLQSISFRDDVDFAVDNQTEIFCPVCCESETFSTWKDAFENPLAYFETEQLCDACGGEKIDRFIKKRHVYQCDKCGLQTDFKEE